MQLTLTSNAIEKVKVLPGGARRGSGLGPAGCRPSRSGCSGFQYGVDLENAPEEDDEILVQEGLRIFVDPFSAQYLDGVEVDYKSSMMGAGFAFSNPQATRRMWLRKLVYGLRK